MTEQQTPRKRRRRRNPNDSILTLLAVVFGGLGVGIMATTMSLVVDARLFMSRAELVQGVVLDEPSHVSSKPWSRGRSCSTFSVAYRDSRGVLRSFDSGRCWQIAYPPGAHIDVYRGQSTRSQQNPARVAPGFGFYAGNLVMFLFGSTFAVAGAFLGWPEQVGTFFAGLARVWRWVRRCRSS
jgi:hypothetical protein